MVNILMTLFWGLIIISCIKSLTNKSEFVFMNKGSTDSERGIAILMIILAHIFQNTVLGGYAAVIGANVTNRIINYFGAIGVSIFFFLSGYGNYLSLSELETDAVIKKSIRHVFRLIISFIVCFVLISITRCLVINWFSSASFSLSELITDFFNLRMIGTSTWYLKIQILLYIIAAIAFIFFPHKYRNIAITLGTIIYVLIATKNLLPDYWWKTVMCFSAGSFCAEYKIKLEIIIKKYTFICVSISVVLMGCAYLWILKDSSYIVVPQLISFIVLSMGISLMCNLFRMKYDLLIYIGRASLSIYLIHIGLMSGILKEFINVDLQVLCFAILTIILSIIADRADRALSCIIKKF